nr:spermine synthase [Ktedonobacteraceae bacterium]
MFTEYKPGMIVLSYVQADVLLKAKQAGSKAVAVSPDLGISDVTVKVSDEYVIFPGGERLNWRQIEKIKQADVSCFAVEGEEVWAIKVFSEATNRVCSLLPTKRTPSMLIAGFTMHRIVGIDPMEDTLRKIGTITPIVGRVLDTATGLGYTAIEAAKSAEQVVTLELDPGAQEIARQNPWSRELFTSSKIEQR